MMLVVLGLLLGMAGLLWILVLAIMEADQQTKTGRPRERRSRPLLQHYIAGLGLRNR